MTMTPFDLLRRYQCCAWKVTDIPADVCKPALDGMGRMVATRSLPVCLRYTLVCSRLVERVMPFFGVANTSAGMGLSGALSSAYYSFHGHCSRGLLFLFVLLSALAICLFSSPLPHFYTLHSLPISSCMVASLLCLCCLSGLLWEAVWCIS